MNVPPFAGSLISEPIAYIRPTSNTIAYPPKNPAVNPAAGQ
jgi:hypothetical protein